MRYSVARQSVTEQQEMLVPGTSRLRNHGPSAGSASAGGCAPTAAGNSRAAMSKRRVMTRTSANRMPRREPRGGPRNLKTSLARRLFTIMLRRGNSLHRQARMDAAAVERSELRSQRRDRDLGQCLGRPAPLAMHHPYRPHMAIERQLTSALVEHLTVDVAGPLGREKNAKRGDRIRTAAA